jgi:hypothetical protein
MSLTSCSSSKELTAENREQQRTDSIANSVAIRMIQNKVFMFTADQIYGSRGRQAHVTSNTNFISVKGNQATIQIAPGIVAGPNGVGGVTFKGSVSAYRVDTKKNGDTVVKFQFNSNFGSGDVILTLYKRSLRASAFINSTFYRGKAQMLGTIEAPGSSRIIEGYAR